MGLTTTFDQVTYMQRAYERAVFDLLNHVDQTRAYQKLTLLLSEVQNNKYLDNEYKAKFVSLWRDQVTKLPEVAAMQIQSLQQQIKDLEVQRRKLYADIIGEVRKYDEADADRMKEQYL